MEYQCAAFSRTRISPHFEHDPYPSTLAEEGSREGVDAKCRQLTASWQREKAKTDDSVELCELFEGHEMAGSEALLPAGAGLGGAESLLPEGEIRRRHSIVGHAISDLFHAESALPLCGVPLCSEHTRMLTHSQLPRLTLHLALPPQACIPWRTCGSLGAKRAGAPTSSQGT